MHDHADRSAEISDYVDGELDAARARELERHLDACAECRATLATYRGLSARARSLAPADPARDLWPGIRGRMRTPLFDRRVWIAATVAVLVTSAAWVLARRIEIDRQSRLHIDVTGGTGEQRFALLLHEPIELADPSQRTPEELAGLVDEYRRWARDLAQRGRLESGEKLADAEGFVLRGGRTDARGVEAGLGGFFVVRAPSYDEAVAIARTCPHLAHGGWIEVRRIEDT